MLLVLSFKGVRYLANNHSALRLKGIILAIVGACLWGLGGTVSDFLFKYKNINVDWYVTARLVVSGIFLLIMYKLVKLIQYVLVAQYVFLLTIEQMIKQFDRPQSHPLQRFV